MLWDNLWADGGADYVYTVISDGDGYYGRVIWYSADHAGSVGTEKYQKDTAVDAGRQDRRKVEGGEVWTGTDHAFAEKGHDNWYACRCGHGYDRICSGRTARKNIPESRRRGGRTGMSEWKYAASGGAFTMGTWVAACRGDRICGSGGGNGNGSLRCYCEKESIWKSRTGCIQTLIIYQKV